MSSTDLTGPILKFQGLENEKWHTSATLVMEEQENPTKLHFSSIGKNKRKYRVYCCINTMNILYTNRNGR